MPDKDFPGRKFSLDEIGNFIAVDVDDDGNPDAVGVVNPDGSAIGSMCVLIDDFDAAVSTWAMIPGSATDNVTSTIVHKIGQRAVVFDKTAAGVLCGICKTWPVAIDLGIGAAAKSMAQILVTMPAVAGVNYAFVRLGTDATNYCEYRFVAASLVIGWNLLSESMQSNGWTQVGNGLNTSSVTYAAVGVVTTLAATTLIGVVADAMFVTQLAETDVRGVTLVTTPAVTVPGVATEATLQTLQQSMERGTATAGGAATLTDTAKNWDVNVFAGGIVRIAAGTGIGQVREVASNTATILTVKTAWAVAPIAGSVYVIEPMAPPVFMEDSGLATAGGASTLTDAAKDWAVNIWGNYNVRITAGTGIGQVRRLLSNTANILTTTAAWGVQPDATSKYSIWKGYFVALTNEVDANVKHVNGTVQTAADWTPLLQSVPLDQGIATSGAVGALNDTAKGWEVNALAGALVRIISGTGAGQVRVIASNTANQIVPRAVFAVAPAAASVYSVLSVDRSVYVESGMATAGAAATLTDATKVWQVNLLASFNLQLVSGTGVGQMRSIISNTANEITVAAWTTPPDTTSGYVIQRGLAIAALPAITGTVSAEVTKIGGTAQTGADLTVIQQAIANALRPAAAADAEVYYKAFASGTAITFLWEVGGGKKPMVDWMLVMCDGTATTVTLTWESGAVFMILPLAANQWVMVDRPMAGQTADKDLQVTTAAGGNTYILCHKRDV